MPPLHPGNPFCTETLFIFSISTAGINLFATYRGRSCTRGTEKQREGAMKGLGRFRPSSRRRQHGMPEVRRPACVREPGIAMGNGFCKKLIKKLQVSRNVLKTKIVFDCGF